MFDSFASFFKRSLIQIYSKKMEFSLDKWLENWLFGKGKILQTFLQLCFTPLLFQLLYLPEVKDLLDFANWLSMFILFASIFLKFYNMKYRAKEIQNLAARLKSELINYKEIDKIQVKVLRTERVFRWYWRAVFFGILGASFIPIFTRKLAFKIYTPFGIDNPLLFWLTVIYQHIATVVLAKLDTALEAICSLFMTYASAMQEHLCDQVKDLKNLENIKTTRGKNLRRKKLIEISNFQRN